MDRGITRSPTLCDSVSIRYSTSMSPSWKWDNTVAYSVSIESSFIVCPMGIAHPHVGNASARASACPSAFNRPGEGAADHVALCKKKDDDDGHDHDQANHSGIGKLKRDSPRSWIKTGTQRRRARNHGLNTYGQIVERIVIEHDVGEEKVIPVRREVDKCQQPQQRGRQR